MNILHKYVKLFKLPIKSNKVESCSKKLNGKICKCVSNRKKRENGPYTVVTFYFQIHRVHR